MSAKAGPSRLLQRLVDDWARRHAASQAPAPVPVQGKRGFWASLAGSWGDFDETGGTVVTRWVFMRAMGFIYLFAFGSLGFQIRGLVGSQGITPAAPFLAAVHQQLGREAYTRLPTLFWLGCSDRALSGVCWVGAFLALLLVADIAPLFMLALMWAFYLSLVNVCGIFLGYQWDILLLETGFLAIFYAPFQVNPGQSSRSPPSRVVLWLLRYLLFRLMFSSGIVKLLSNDPSWWHLTALEFHYETQPLPPWTAWYAHQLPAAFQHFCCAVMFGIELVLPFFIFLTRPFRYAAMAGLVFLQLLIVVTGNYCFFNYLTIALCITLADDALWPERWRRAARGSDDDASRALLPRELLAGQVGGIAQVRADLGGRDEAVGLALGQTVTVGVTDAQEEAFWIQRRRWARWIIVPFGIAMFVLGTVQFLGRFGVGEFWPDSVRRFMDLADRFYLSSSYGLFAVMTTERDEIVLEGTRDGRAWIPYAFKYKPGDPMARPNFIAPFQPRVDWQMWFASLGSYRENPWLLNMCARLLQGSPDVLSLLAADPFNGAPPRAIRAVLYQYHFTDTAEARTMGAWWRREEKGPYCPEISLSKKE